MPKYKLLRGVAHNLGHSFLSLMNYLKYDYCLDYLYAVSRIKKIDNVEIDFLNCELKPKYFNLKQLKRSVYQYRKDLYKKLDKLKINIIGIESVKMKVKFGNKIKKITESHKLNDKVFVEIIIKLKDGKEYGNIFQQSWPLDSDKNYDNLYNKITK